MSTLRSIALAAILPWLVLFSCSGGDHLSGGTVETTNGVTACLKTPDGSAASGAIVTLKHICITAAGDSVVTEAAIVADDSGQAHFADVKSGKYILLVRDSARGLMAMNSRLRKDPADSLVACTLRLHAPVTICGRIMLSTGIPPLAQAYAFVPGLGAKVPVDGQGRYILRNVPADTLDIAIVFGATVNYVPVCIQPSPDTVFIKDVHIAVSQGTTAIRYGYYDNTVSACFAVVPQQYDSGNEPLWYAGKTFDRVTYFRPAPDGTLIEFAGGNVNILFVVVPQQWKDVGGQISYQLTDDDAAIQGHLQNRGFAVFIADGDNPDPSDTAGMSCILIAAFVPKTSIYRDMPKPVICCEDSLFGAMDMCREAGVKYGQNWVVINKPNHPLAAGLGDTVRVVCAASAFSWGIPAASAAIIAYVPGYPDDAAIFAYEKGDMMLTKAAPERRVGFFLGENASQELESFGWRLFDAAVKWALGY
jgi:hypothetical protein